MKTFKSWLAEKKSKIVIGEPEHDSENVLIISDIKTSSLQAESNLPDKECFESSEVLREMAESYNRLSNLPPYKSKRREI